MIKVTRRNFSSAARRYANARGIIVSIPKSGRTWLRVFLHAYCCALENREFTLDERAIDDSDISRFIFTHDLWEHLKTARFKDRIRGKYLVPSGAVQGKPILLLARDPRDVIVSLFFQLSKRRHLFKGSMSDLLYDPRFGVQSVVEVMNTWLEDWAKRGNFMLIRYEDCRRDVSSSFKNILGFFGFKEIDEQAFDRSLDFSSFENMKAMEARGAFQSKILLPEDPGDPDSFKVRRGIVGGYREYLSERDLVFLEKAMISLDPRYGYDSRSDVWKECADRGTE